MTGSTDTPAGPTDVAGVLAGHTTDLRGRTGCTAFLFPTGAQCAVHVPGSATGTREMGVLQPGHLSRQIHGLVFSGGSAFGLATADGVMEHLASQGIGKPVGREVVPIVPAAILFDRMVATRVPTHEDGLAAARAASSKPLREGLAGAGTGARVGMAAGKTQPGGFGTAAAEVAGHTIATAVACNAVGSIVGEDGSWLAGGPPILGEVGSEGENTTLVAVFTDAPLDREACTVVAKMASAGMARAIVPAFGPFDGDIVFAVATSPPAEVAPGTLGALGHVAATLVERAIRRAVTVGR